MLKVNGIKFATMRRACKFFGLNENAMNQKKYRTVKAGKKSFEIKKNIKVEWD